MIHGMNPPTTPRVLTPRLQSLLATVPSLFLIGAPRVGKRTLATAAEPTRNLIDLGRFELLRLARQNPEALLAQHPRPIIADIMKAPELLHAANAEVERGTAPGRFVFVGGWPHAGLGEGWEVLLKRSRSVLVAPLTRRERLGLASVWTELFKTPVAEWRGVLSQSEPPEEDWRAAARRGGMPSRVLDTAGDEERAAWFADYLRLHLQSEILATIDAGNLPRFHRFLHSMALRNGLPVRQRDMSRALLIPQPTVRRWIETLGILGLVQTVHSYQRILSVSALQAPKTYLFDTAFGLHLAGNPEPGQAQLEAIVYNELKSWGESEAERVFIAHWRSYSGESVDFMVEYGNATLPVQVSTKEYPYIQDATGILELHALRSYERPTHPGLLVYGGNETRWLHPLVLAVPWWRVA